MSDETTENNNKQLQPDDTQAQAEITSEELRGWVNDIMEYLNELHCSMREIADLLREKHDAPKTPKRKATKKKARRW